MIDPATLIPHRPPFLLVSGIDTLSPGSSASGYLDVDPRLEILKGHFPGNPILPGVYLIEAIAQLGAATVLADDRYGGTLPLFGGIDRARFRHQVRPGDRVDLEISMTTLSARAGKGSGRATVSGKLAAEVDLFFVIAKA